VAVRLDLSYASSATSYRRRSTMQAYDSSTGMWLGMLKHIVWILLTILTCHN